MVKFILLSIFSYLLGSICFGHIVGKIKKINLEKIGSGSYTTANVSRALGWKWASFTAISDFLKGVIPSCLAVNYLSENWQVVIVSLLPTIGHIYPLFFKFKGGKGGATFLGSCLSLVGIRLFFFFFLVWLSILGLSKKMSLVNLVFPWIFTFYLYINLKHYLLFGILGSLIVNFALRENIGRLISGKELKTPFKI